MSEPSPRPNVTPSRPTSSQTVSPLVETKPALPADTVRSSRTASAGPSTSSHGNATDTSTDADMAGGGGHLRERDREPDSHEDDGLRGGGDDSMALRRREANRLAAQRFRSRKKGYQDSLEEKVRALEEEKGALARRLERVEDAGIGSSGRHHGYGLDDDGRFGRGGGSQVRRSPSSDLYGSSSRGARHSGRSASPILREARDGLSDAEVRVTGLEAANRRLQDELRSVYEENDRLRAELDRWREWTRESREPPRGGERDRERDRDYHIDYLERHRPTLLPVDMGAARYPTNSVYPVPPSKPTIERGTSFGNSVPVTRASHAQHATSPSIQLPPLRLPPLSGAPPMRPLLSPQMAPPMPLSATGPPPNAPFAPPPDRQAKDGHTQPPFPRA